MNDDGTEAFDPLSIIDDLQQFRETVRGIVAMFVADGFSDGQARDLAVATVVNNLRAAGAA